MRKFPLLIATLLAVACLSGCSADAAQRDGLPSVVATNFPQYDFARTIAGGRASITMLLPPGSESHVYEPTPRDIVLVSGADLFIYTGPDLEPWAGRLLDGISSASLTVVDISDGIELSPLHEDEGDSHSHDELRFDPHIWLDPTRAIAMCQNICAALSAIEPGGAPVYQANLAALTADIEALDADIQAAVDAAPGKTMVFGGRFAFAYFIERYNLDFVGVLDSCSTEAEPSPQDVIRVVEYVTAHGVPVIYHEELADPKTANAIAAQTGAKALLFHSCHNVTRGEFDGGTTYIDLMRRNLANLVEGLG